MFVALRQELDPAKHVIVEVHLIHVRELKGQNKNSEHFMKIAFLVDLVSTVHPDLVSSNCKGNISLGQSNSGFHYLAQTIKIAVLEIVNKKNRIQSFKRVYFAAGFLPPLIRSLTSMLQGFVPYPTCNGLIEIITPRMNSLMVGLKPLKTILRGVWISMWRDSSRFILYALSCMVFLVSAVDRPETPEIRLLRNIFDNHDNQVRPVFNRTDVINVQFSLSLIQIVNVNSKSQLLSTSVWIRQTWKNPFLTWNPDDYGGIDVINIDPSKIWIPDIILYNNADDTYGGGTEKYKTKVIIKADGTCSWFSPASFTSTCKINVKLFPFDWQTCIMKFGSWTYGGDRLTMTSATKVAETSKYITNGEWDLIIMRAQRNKIKYNCCKYYFYDVTFFLTIKRKPLYYIFNLIVPCALIATLTLIKFFLPPESGEKIGLGITVLLAMTVFLLIVADSLPSTSEHIPLLGSYFIAIMFDTALSLVASCVILNFFHRNPSMSPMPMWVRKYILGYLGWLLCFPNHKKYIEKKIRRLSSPKVSKYFTANGGPDCELTSIEMDRLGGSSYHNDNNLTDISSRSDSFETFMDPVSFKVLEGIGTLADSVRREEEEEFLKDEWRRAALILDRFFFYLFLITTILTTAALFLQDQVIRDGPPDNIQYDPAH
eukprot:gene7314-8131_t